MAVLVADLQRMREPPARDAEEEAQMTRYQEEMLARVMELHQLARGGTGGQGGGGADDKVPGGDVSQGDGA